MFLFVQYYVSQVSHQTMFFIILQDDIVSTDTAPLGAPWNYWGSCCWIWCSWNLFDSPTTVWTGDGACACVCVCVTQRGDPKITGSSSLVCRQQSHPSALRLSCCFHISATSSHLLKWSLGSRGHQMQREEAEKEEEEEEGMKRTRQGGGKRERNDTRK